MSIQSLHKVITKDGEQIAIWQVSANLNDDSIIKNTTVNIDIETNAKLNSHKVKAQNILMIHGTFSDKRVSLGMAGYLAKLGHSCYIMEWRGHGHSSMPKDTFNFETIAFYDVAATFNYLFNELKLDNLHAVTHSGGGICLTMFLTQNQHYIDKLSSITMLACQAYGAVLNSKSYLKIALLKNMTRLLGYVPAMRFKLGPINESYYTMSQWYNWNLSKNFQSSLSKQILKTENSKAKRISNNDQSNNDESNNQNNNNNNKNFDYRQQMADITTPIYAISAKGDTFIAPNSGCKLFLNSFNNSANVFREFSTDYGDLEKYNHSRVILSSNAAKEIWPTIAAWIEGHTKDDSISD